MALVHLQYPYLRLLVIGIVFSLISFSSSGQQRNPPKYNLLWEITGNGLRQPSYLFGAINLNDKRIHVFSDSVMSALSSTSAFALEVHPDTVIDALFNKVATGAVFKSLLDGDYSREDDMPTFTNGYLYGIAKTFKKKILGLEDIATQIEMTESAEEDEDEYFDVDSATERKQAEELIEVYARGNLNEIWIHAMKLGLNTTNLHVRNTAMAARMIEIMRSESLFATVGVIHMPGEEGIIAILKKQGYAVRPVSATFTGQSSKYKIDHAKMEMYSYSDSLNRFKISLPTKPFELSQGNRLKSAVSLDLTNNSIYTSAVVYVGPIASTEKVSFLDSLLFEYLQRDAVTLVEKKPISRENTEGLEAILHHGKKYSRLQMFYSNSTLYTLTVESGSNNVKDSYADIFFNSFNVINTDQKGSAWSKFSSAEGAFSVMMPGAPEYSKNELPNSIYPEHPYELNIYTGLDRVKQVIYLVRYNDFPRGLYLSNSEAVMNGIEAEFKKNGQQDGKAKKVTKDGIAGRSFNVVMNGQMAEVEIYIKANRTYLLLRQNLAGPEPVAGDSFFDSFRIENPDVSESIASTIPSLNLVAPEKMVLLKNATTTEDQGESMLWNSQTYAARNNHTGGTYNVEIAEISPYYRALNVDSLYSIILNGVFDEQEDSIFKSEDIKVENASGRQVFSLSKTSGNARRTRIWIDNNRFFSQTAITDPRELEGKQVADFFDKVMVNSTISFDIHASKANLIMKDLKSADTVARKKAFASLNYYEFNKSELPLIYEALKHKYTDDTATSGTRIKLMNEFLNLNDANTVPVLKEIFNNRDNSDHIRSAALSKVTLVSKASYEWYLKSLLSDTPLNVSDSYSLLSPLRDSLSMMASQFDGLFKLLDHEPYRNNLLYAFNEMLKRPVRSEFLPLFERRKAAWESRIVNDMDKALKKANDLENLDYQLIYTYLDIMPALKLRELTDIYTKKLFAVDSITNVHTSALAARILTGLDVDSKLLTLKLDSLETRMEIMRAYIDAGRENELPLKYRKHDEVAKLFLHNYLLTDADEAPEGLAVLGHFKKDEKIYYVLEFSYTDKDEIRHTYLGVCGGFDEKKEELDLDLYECFTEYELKRADWMEQAKALVEE